VVKFKSQVEIQHAVACIVKEPVVSEYSSRFVESGNAYKLLISTPPMAFASIVGIDKPDRLHRGVWYMGMLITWGGIVCGDAAGEPNKERSVLTEY
jgi:hypothetical protein